LSLLVKKIARYYVLVNNNKTCPAAKPVFEAPGWPNDARPRVYDAPFVSEPGALIDAIAEAFIPNY
jgi:hypothetical protein